MMTYDCEHELRANGWYQGGRENYSWSKNEIYFVMPHGVHPMSQIARQLPELAKPSTSYFLVDTNDGKPWEIIAQAESLEVLITVAKLKELF